MLQSSTYGFVPFLAFFGQNHPDSFSELLRLACRLTALANIAHRTSNAQKTKKKMTINQEEGQEEGQEEEEEEEEEERE